ncbi:MAG: HlyD family secretion protein [Firmicutes bacterium]|nr:HlyD family secretion protein [Bacillota bacterium]
MDKKKLMMIAVAVAMVLTLCGVTGYYWYMGTYYVRTDDARVDGTIVNVSPQITGRISEIYVAEGDTVKEGALIARQVDYSLSQGVNLDMAVIKSPINGTVIKKIGNVGEVGTPGQPIVMVTDLGNVYITADVEETEVSKIRPGQPVDFTVDAFPRVKFTGQVSSVVNATVSTFSLLSSQNTGGNFTKVVQRVSVKISINDAKGCRLMPGMNSTVKIHVR